MENREQRAKSKGREQRYSSYASSNEYRKLRVFSTKERRKRKEGRKKRWEGERRKDMASLLGPHVFVPLYVVNNEIWVLLSNTTFLSRSGPIPLACCVEHVYKRDLD
jgi:hypothetical protein